MGDRRALGRRVGGGRARGAGWTGARGGSTPPVAPGTRPPGVAASDKKCTILCDKLLERHWRPSSDLLDEVIRAREDTVLVIDRDLAQVLKEEVIAFPSLGLGGRLLPGLQGL